MHASPTALDPSHWPPLLREIPDPPQQLFYRGTAPRWNELKFLAIVGSRKYSNYGKEACQTLVAGLAGHPVCIVSGLALGIDSIAHRAALAHGLPTIAVPGSGLNNAVLYPSSHRALADEIVRAGGMLLSEFEPTFRATTWSFPRRNRIMAGISHAILVIEAEQRSGTLITSKLATEYNRDVLAVPGSIFSKSSEGPHMLLRLGATPIGSATDILEALHIEHDARRERDYSDCSPEEMTLLKLVVNPLPREDIAEFIKKPVHELNALLSLLEIKGHIKENGGVIRRTD